MSTEQMKGNQLRLYFSALVYTLMEALRRFGLKGAEWTEAQVDTIRLKLLKIGALIRFSIRHIVLELSSAYPWKDVYAQVYRALLCRFDCYRMERTSSRAGLYPAVDQRLFTAH